MKYLISEMLAIVITVSRGAYFILSPLTVRPHELSYYDYTLLFCVLKEFSFK